jgi:hypothetical protein
MIRFATLLAGTLALAIGCGKPPPQNAPKPPEKIETELPGTVRGYGWHIRWTSRDPKRPNRALPMLIADAKQGLMYARDDAPSMKMIGVRAQLFREGVHTANLEAGTLEANRQEKVLHGANGVKLVSLDPARALTVTADAMRWEMKTNRIEAEGHARIVRAAQQGQLAGTAEAPRILLDAKTGEYELIGESH